MVPTSTLILKVKTQNPSCLPVLSFTKWDMSSYLYSFYIYILQLIFLIFTLYDLRPCYSVGRIKNYGFFFVSWFFYFK